MPLAKNKNMGKNVDIKVNNLSVNGIIENSEAEKITILVHGFTGDWHGPQKIFEKLSKRLQQNGYAVLRFNFRGTPPSDGNFENMTVETETEDLNEVIKYLKKLGYTEIGVLGESMGGTIATTAYDPSLKVVIFWYPAFDFSDTDFKELLHSESSKEEYKKQGYILCDGFKVGKQFINECLSVNVFSKLKKIKCPTLILHGDNDKEVPYQQSEKAFQIFNKPKEIHIIKGADHCFLNEQDEVIDLTMNFIQQYF